MGRGREDEDAKASTGNDTPPPERRCRLVSNRRHKNIRTMRPTTVSVRSPAGGVLQKSCEWASSACIILYESLANPSDER